MNHKSGYLFYLARNTPVALGVLTGAMLLIWVVNLYAQNPRPIENAPPGQPFAEGRKLFEGICAGCHGLDGRGGERGPDIAARTEVQRMSDPEILQVLKSGRPAAGMPAFGSLGDEKPMALLNYLRALQGKGVAPVATGDPQRGKVIFLGKAKCSECHMVNGAGGFLGSDLSAYGLAHSTVEIRNAIVNPGSETETGRRAIAVTTRDGHKYAGISRNEDNFSLQLQSLDGTFHLFAKSEIERMEYLPKPLMPADYGSTLTPHELDDLVSYLVGAAKTRGTVKVKRRRWEDEDNN